MQTAFTTCQGGTTLLYLCCLMARKDRERFKPRPDLNPGPRSNLPSLLRLPELYQNAFKGEGLDELANLRIRVLIECDVITRSVAPWHLCTLLTFPGENPPCCPDVTRVPWGDFSREPLYTF